MTDLASEHANVALLRRAHHAFYAGDFDTLRSLFSPDIRWHAHERNKTSGDFIGQDQVFAHFGVFAGLIEDYTSPPTDFLVSDDRVAMTAHVSAQRGSERLECDEISLWRVEGGKLVECWHIPLDLAAWDTFFS